MSRLKVFLLGLAVIGSLAAFVGQQTTNETRAAIEEGINWIDMEELDQLSKTAPKKVFVDVYTNWCGYCKKMDRSTFSDPEVIDYVNENFYAVKLNAESNQVLNFKGQQITEAQLAQSMRVRSYPTIVFMDEKIETIQPVPGYRTAGQFRKMLMSFNKH